MTSDGTLVSTQTEEQAVKAYEDAKKLPEGPEDGPKEEPGDKLTDPTETTEWTFEETGEIYTTRAEAEKAVKAWYQEEYNYLLDEYDTIPDWERDEQWIEDWNTRNQELEEKKEEYLNDIKKLPHFKTGGLANFTGPAWLDGTRSKPEYILNASQTQAFLSLVDVLEHFRGNFKTGSSENFGDSIIDIDINIETVKEEADIDMLTEKLQKAIVSSAQYRNNTFIQR